MATPARTAPDPRGAAESPQDAEPLGRWEQLAVLEGHRDAVLHVAFTAEGRQLVSVSLDATKRTWDLYDGATLFVRDVGQYMKDLRPAGPSAESQDGLYSAVYSKSDRRVRVVDEVTGAEVQDFSAPGAVPTAIGFSSDGRTLAIGGEDGVTRLWDLSVRKVTVELRGHTEAITSLAFSPGDDRLASGSADSTIRLYRRAGRERSGLERAWPAREIRFGVSVSSGPQKAVCHLGVSDDRSGQFNRRFVPTTRFFFGMAGDAPSTLGYHAECRPGAMDVTFQMREWRQEMKTSPQQQPHRQWAVWDGITGKIITSLGDNLAFLSAAFSPDGRFIATAEGGGRPSADAESEIRLLDISADKKTFAKSVPWPENGMPILALSAGARRLAFAGDRLIRIWDTATDSPAGPTIGDASDTTPLALSWDGEWVAYNDQTRTVRVREIRTGKLSGPLAFLQKDVSVLAFSPDGRYLAGAGQGDSDIHVWGIRSGAVEMVFRRHGNRCDGLAFDASGRNIFCSGYAGVDVFRLPRREPGREAITARLSDDGLGNLFLSGNMGDVESAKFFMAGDRLLFGTSAGVVSLWDGPVSGWQESISKNGCPLSGGGWGAKDVFCAIPSAQHPRLTVLGRMNAAVTAVGFDCGNSSCYSAVSHSADGLTRHWSGAPDLDGVGQGWRSDWTARHPGELVSASAVHLAAATKDRIRIYNLSQSNMYGDNPTNEISKPGISAFAFMGETVAGAGLVAGHEDGAVSFWSTMNRVEKEGGYRAADSAITVMAAYRPEQRSSNPGILALGDRSGSLKIVRLIDRKSISLGPLTPGPLTALGFSADGRFLVSVTSATEARLWEIPQGKLKAVVHGKAGGMKAVSISPDGRTLAFGGAGAPLQLVRLTRPFPGLSRNPTVTFADEPSVQPQDDVDTPPVARSRPDPEAYAVVIGVEKYQLKSIPKVDFASRDAQTMQAYLTQTMGFDPKNTILLRDEEASKGNIEKYLGPWLRNHATAKSRVFVYFAGHGAPDAEKGTRYVVPYDGDPNYIAETGYSIRGLYEALSKLPSQDVRVVFDACFIGQGARSLIAQGARPLVSVLESEDGIGANTVVIAATGGKQISTYYPAGQHGLLTHFLFKGLQGAADLDGDGAVSTAELFRYAKPIVEREARLQNVSQTPTITPALEALGRRGGRVWVRRQGGGLR